jgi:ATP-dependent RNA/DNA helicase IGHMBP2
MRDLEHFDLLTRLLELERNAERARSVEELRDLPLGELEARGRVVLDVEVVDETIGLGGRFLLTLVHAEGRPLKARLFPGDLVTVRPRKAELTGEPPRALVSRGGRHRIQLAFDRSPPSFVSEGRLRLDITANDITFDRARRALAQVKAMEHGQQRRLRQVLLGAEPPRFDKPRPIDPQSRLNPEQRDAVARALSAEDFFLVHGPPGTGKSTVLAEIAEVTVGEGKRLLCTAASNAAVDHLLELCLARGLRALRVGHPARVLPHLQEHTLDVVVEDHPDRKLSRELFDEAFDLLGYARRQRNQGRARARFANAREASAEAKKMLDDARALERKAVRSVLDRAQVICVTCATLGSQTGPIAGEKFDLALLDEATQAVEPIALLAFLRAPKVILAGDPQQLAPTILSREASEKGLGVSLFERLLKEHGDGVKQLLREQHRMHEQLMAFPSREMYGGQLRAHPSAAHRTLAEVLSPGAVVDAPPLLFLDTAGKGHDESSEPGSQSLRNPGEAALVFARAQELLGAGLTGRELAIIAPYSAQAALLRELTQELPTFAEVEIDTVDAFQGREKDAILLTLTRSNAEGSLGFLTDLRRINVAITRARRHLFVVGDSATLSNHPFYARLIESTQTDGGYRSAWEWPDPLQPVPG